MRQDGTANEAGISRAWCEVASVQPVIGHDAPFFATSVRTVPQGPRYRSDWRLSPAQQVRYRGFLNLDPRYFEINRNEIKRNHS